MIFMDFSAQDRQYMSLALKLARQAIGKTSPNPLVGVVIVKNNQIVGRGYHRQAGSDHAEVLAIKQAGSQAKGATLYVNLEPCCHQGRTPPCTRAIIKAGIKSVVLATCDPNPLVAGKGIEELKKSGIYVQIGLLEKQARRLNEKFFKYITSGRPFITMKAALTLDGKIATSMGDSRWITGEKARKYVHLLRSRYDAVMVGIGTVIKDDPRLTCRLPGKHKQPVRIVADSQGRIPLGSKIILQAKAVKTIIATTKSMPGKKKQAITQAGAQVLTLKNRQERVDLSDLFPNLGRQQVTSVLVEGGSRLNSALLKAGLVDKLLLFYAPKVLGSGKAVPWLETGDIKNIKDCLGFNLANIRRFDNDILLELYPERK